MIVGYSKTLLLAVTLAVISGLAFILAWIRGAISIPRDDDWSYLNVAVDWAQTGSLSLNGWVHMMYVSQGIGGFFVVKLFGYSVLLLDVLGLVAGVLGLWILFGLAKKVLGAGFAVLVVLMVGLSPLWLHLSPTFMTDVPSWALTLVSISLGIAAMRGQQTYLLVLGACAALVGFGVREYAIVPFLALLLWVIWSKYPKRFRFSASLIGVVTVAIGAVAYLWRQSLPGSVETMPLPAIDSLALDSRLVLTLALLLAPYAAVCTVLTWSRKGGLLATLRSNWLGASIGTVLAVGIAFTSTFQLAGNVIHPYGSSWTSVGDGVRSLPLSGFRAVTLVGIVSLVVLLALVGMLVQRRIVARSWRVLERPLVSSNLAGLYVFISAAVLAVYFVAIHGAGAPAFDRYLLLVVPLLGIAVLWLATRSLKDRISIWQKSAVAGILIVTGAFGLIITDGLNQVDGLRWKTAYELVDSGIPAYKIDGGDAWFRYHQKDAPGVARVGSLENSIPGRTWWQTFFEGSSFCRMVAIESETDLQAMYGPALSIQEERTLLGTPFRVIVFPGPDPC